MVKRVVIKVANGDVTTFPQARVRRGRRRVTVHSLHPDEQGLRYDFPNENVLEVAERPADV